MDNLEIDKIHLGDCLDLMKGIPDESIDMILCDLPYGTTKCKWDTIIPFNLLWLHYKRIIKLNGATVLCGSQPFSSFLITSNPMMFRHSWVWNKGVAASFALCNIAPLKVHEDILVFSKEKVHYFPIKTPRDKVRIDLHKQKQYDTAPLQKRFNHAVTYIDFFPTSILNISNRKEKRGLHPTQKPVSLFEYLIRTYTNEGMLILDNCIGSGTTAVAAKNLKRHFIGIEKEEKYYKIACERVGQDG